MKQQMTLMEYLGSPLAREDIEKEVRRHIYAPESSEIHRDAIQEALKNLVFLLKMQPEDIALLRDELCRRAKKVGDGRLRLPSKRELSDFAAEIPPSARALAFYLDADVLRNWPVPLPVLRSAARLSGRLAAKSLLNSYVRDRSRGSALEDLERRARAKLDAAGDEDLGFSEILYRMVSDVILPYLFTEEPQFFEVAQLDPVDVVLLTFRHIRKNWNILDQRIAALLFYFVYEDLEKGQRFLADRLKGDSRLRLRNEKEKLVLREVEELADYLGEMVQWAMRRARGYLSEDSEFVAYSDKGDKGYPVGLKKEVIASILGVPERRIETTKAMLRNEFLRWSKEEAKWRGRQQRREKAERPHRAKEYAGPTRKTVEAKENWGRRRRHYAWPLAPRSSSRSYRFLKR